MYGLSVRRNASWGNINKYRTTTHPADTVTKRYAVPDGAQGRCHLCLDAPGLVAKYVETMTAATRFPY